MTRATTAAGRAPRTLDSMKRLARAMPVEQQLELIRHLADGGDFGGFDDRDTIAMDRALANMVDCAVSDRMEENRRMHGEDVGAIPHLHQFAGRARHLDPVAWGIAS